MLPLGHIGLRAERGDDRDCRLTPDERRSLLALWCMGRSPLMVGGDLPTSTSQTIAALANPALREVTAGSRNNHETVRERIFASWDDENSYRGELIVWAADAADWADGTMSAHDGGHYAALFWTGDDAFELGRNIELQSIVGLDRTRRPLDADRPVRRHRGRRHARRRADRGRRSRPCDSRHHPAPRRAVDRPRSQVMMALWSDDELRRPRGFLVWAGSV